MIKCENCLVFVAKTTWAVMMTLRNIVRQVRMGELWGPSIQTQVAEQRHASEQLANLGTTAPPEWRRVLKASRATPGVHGLRLF